MGLSGQHSLGVLPLWARRQIAGLELAVVELEHTVFESEALHGGEVHKVRMEVIEADGRTQLAEQRLEYARRDLRRANETIRGLCDIIRRGHGIGEVPEGMDPREWIG